METVQRISKPHLVDFLRMCDKNRWCSPRIRYASIRSKPELCADIKTFFTFSECSETRIEVRSIRQIRGFPNLEYDLKQRAFLVDGKTHDFPRMIRQKPRFSLRREPVTLVFGDLYCTPGSGTVSAASLGFP